MRRIIRTATGGMAAVLLLAGTAAAQITTQTQGKHLPAGLSTTDGAPVELQAAPGSLADRLARRLLAREIEVARSNGEKPLVLVGMGRLNDREEMLFVQLQSPRECGSAGCSIISFKSVNGRWIKAIDTVGGAIRIAATRHREMPDVFVNNSRFIWNGAEYSDAG